MLTLGKYREEYQVPTPMLCKVFCMKQKECIVLVTGASRGIGRSIALRFARDGCDVIVTFNTERDKALETRRLALEQGARSVLVIQMNVADINSVHKARKEVDETYGRLNVLVNNAGVLHIGSIDETSFEDWERTLKINLTGVFLVTKMFLPLLRRAKWASIVNIASIAGQTGNIVASVAYAASKAGVIGLTRRLAVELAPEGIRVNAVAPSFVETDMVRDFMDTPEKRKRMEEMHPLRTIIRPEDVAELVYFLAKPETARTITGQVIGINAGRLTC